MARKFAAEGCNIAINYASNVDVARELSNHLEQTYEVKTTTIQAVRRSDSCHKMTWKYH